jgi:hypothetical protein
MRTTALGAGTPAAETSPDDTVLRGEGRRLSGERRPVSPVRFEDYITGCVESYAGRTA